MKETHHEFADESVSSRHYSTPKRSSLSSQKIVAVVVVIALPILGFWAGVGYEHGKGSSTASAAGTMRNGQFGGQAGGFQRGNRAIGQVTAVSSTSITISSRRTNTDKTYAITSSTTVTNNGQTAAVSDIQVGDTVFITPDTTTATNAASIALNPSFGGGPGGNSTAAPSDGSSDQSTMTQ